MPRDYSHHKRGYKYIQISLDPAVGDQLKRIADQDDRSLTSLIRHVLRQYVDRRQD